MAGRKPSGTKEYQQCIVSALRVRAKFHEGLTSYDGIACDGCRPRRHRAWHDEGAEIECLECGVNSPLPADIPVCHYRVVVSLSGREVLHECQPSVQLRRNVLRKMKTA